MVFVFAMEQWTSSLLSLGSWRVHEACPTSLCLFMTMHRRGSCGENFELSLLFGAIPTFTDGVRVWYAWVVVSLYVWVVVSLVFGGNWPW